MVELNRAAADALRPFAPNAVTDVTGFGLLGHAHELAERSGVRVVLEADALPALPGALELAERGVLTGGDRRNREFAEEHVESTADAAREALAYDPQTAGGLLVSLPADRAAVLEATFAGSRPRALPHRRCRGRSRGRLALMAATVLARARTLAPPTFLKLALASCATLFLVVTSGAFVRLTGSGLGCENWPQCGDKPYPEQGFHAFVEFGNRLVALTGLLLTLATWLGATRVAGLPRGARLAALGAFLLTLAQVPMGAITIALDLHPLAVMTHFLLALVVLALAVVVAIEAGSLVGGLSKPAGPSWLRKLVVWAGLPTCAALVVTGAVATASGPHPGADEDVERLGLEIADTVYVHVRVAAAFGLGVLFIGWFLVRMRDRYPGLVLLWGGLVAALGAQAIVGEVQYRTALPWGLVLVHVFLAAAIWAFAVALAYALWRPPAPLVRQ